MKRYTYVAVSLVVILCLCGVIGCAPSKVASPPEEKEPLEITKRSILRLYGSNSMGERLIPELAEAFLKEQGAIKTVRQSEVKANRILVKGFFPNSSEPQVVEILSKDSDMAFKSLSARKCDIGFTSRRIEDEEVKAFASLGSMTSQKSEHILALDGLAIIVQRNNPVETLTIEQIRGIFSGKIQDWQAVGGRPGKITVYAPDQHSGACEAFQQTLFGKTQLTRDVLRIQSDVELSNKVGNDIAGIGFVRAAYTRQAKVLGINDGKSLPLKPEAFHIGTEDYLLSHRLYLYLSENSTNTTAKAFIEFALSGKGQKIVALNNLVDLTIKAIKTIDPLHSPTDVIPSSVGAEQYIKITKKAVQLSLNIRFRRDESGLDNKAQRDIARIVEFLDQHPESHTRAIALFGFADNNGSRSHNQDLSEKRAESVAKKLRDKGLSPVKVVGFGEDIPVATNDTEEGQARNRRVEVWLLNSDISLPDREDMVDNQQPEEQSEELSELDPDRNSKANRIPKGATKLTLKDTEKGDLNYDNGDKTDWYQVQIAEEGQFAYKIEQKSPDTTLSIQFYAPVPDYQSLPDHPVEEIILKDRETQSYTIEKTQPGTYYSKICVQHPGEVSKHVIYTNFTPTKNKVSQELSSLPPQEPQSPKNPQPPQIIISSPEYSPSDQKIVIRDEAGILLGRVEAGRTILQLKINDTNMPLETVDSFVPEKQQYVQEFSYPLQSLEVGEYIPITIAAWDIEGDYGELRFRVERIPVSPVQPPNPGDAPPSESSPPSLQPLKPDSESPPEPEPDSAADDLAPVITISSPAPNTRVTQKVISIKGRVEDESPIDQITVNDKIVSAGKARGFTAETLQVQEFVCSVELTSGHNSIVITAQDQFGNQARKVIPIHRAE